MLLQEFWDDRYVGYCERLREVTRVGYESAWRCHVEPVFGSMELADIGVDDIELWLSGFASPGAARKAWAVLRQMLRKAAKWGYLEVDVTRLEIDLPAKPLHVPRLLTIGQTRRQLQGFYGHALEAWLIVARVWRCGRKRGTESIGRISICVPASLISSVECNGWPATKWWCRRRLNCPTGFCPFPDSPSGDCGRSATAGRAVSSVT